MATYAIAFSSGRHANCSTPPGAVVAWRTSPFGRITNTCDVVSPPFAGTSAMNARPSLYGAQRADDNPARASIAVWRMPVATSITSRSRTRLSCSRSMRVTTTRMCLPSGESCGVPSDTMRNTSSYPNARGAADARGPAGAAAETAAARAARATAHERMRRN